MAAPDRPTIDLAVGGQPPREHESRTGDGIDGVFTDQPDIGVLARLLFLTAVPAAG
jgi:hypothetical protein